MTKRWTHKACFDFFGVAPRNPRWSWSGRSADGSKVAVTFWKDQFEDGTRVYRAQRPGDAKIAALPGHKELLENLKWSQERCEGIVHIIIAVPKDRNAEPRSIAECYPSKLRMKITNLDMETGDFIAERIE